MPIIKPFKALRANEKNIRNFPSLTIDNYSLDDIRKKVDDIYDSILQVIFPTFNSSQDSKTNHKEVRKNFEDFIEKGKIADEDQQAFYIYQQKGKDFEHKGIVALFDMRDRENNEFRVHENTLTKREELFADYLNEVHVQSEPVLVTYPSNSKIELLIQQAMKSKILMQYVDDEGTEHKIWKMDNRLNMQNYIDTFKRMEAIYVADGHHRLASTQRYCKSQKEADDEYIGNEPYHFVLGYAVGSDHLKIYEYNRLVKDLNGLSKEEFLDKLSKNFSIVKKGEETYFPSHKHHISMYLDGEFYGLYIDHELRGKPEGLGELDTYLFEELISKPILGIHDSSTDDRVDFLKGSSNKDGILAMKEKVDNGPYEVAFGFYPVTFHDLKLISDLGLKMPPKSTYIRPKLLTGLLMYNMKK